MSSGTLILFCRGSSFSDESLRDTPPELQLRRGRVFGAAVAIGGAYVAADRLAVAVGAQRLVQDRGGLRLRCERQNSKRLSPRSRSCLTELFATKKGIH